MYKLYIKNQDMFPKKLLNEIGTEKTIVNSKERKMTKSRYRNHEQISFKLEYTLQDKYFFLTKVKKLTINTRFHHL